MTASEVRNKIDALGGWEPFLAWCEATVTDVRSTFDILDVEWAQFHVAGQVDGKCPAYKNGGPASECVWCNGSWKDED